MSSASSYPRCTLEARPGRLLFFHACLIAAGAVIAPWMAGLPPVVAILAAAFAVPWLVPLFRWAHGPLRSVTWLADGRWLLVARDGREHEALLAPGIFIGSRMIALHWRCHCCNRRFRAAFLYGSCDRDGLRRMVVRLRATPDSELFPS